MATPAIKVEGLGKKYRLVHGQERTRYRTLRDTLVDAVKAPFRKRGTTEEFWALNDVSFEVQPGEVVGIIGRNGAGKSTLLKILSRITKPTTGRVEITGRVGSLLEVGTGFHPELTGRENIYLNGAILGMTRAEISKKFDEIVAFAEVEKFLDTPVKRYSSGMYVRLAFAVAAHLEPEILIVDEVLAVGDQAFQKKCLGKIREVGSSGRTVLFVSHNTDVVLALCSRCVVLRRGGVIADGPPDSTVALHLGDALADSEGQFDLHDHPARKSGKAPLLTHLTLSDARRPTTGFVTNEEFIAEMTVSTAQAVTQPRVALAVEDAFGRRLFTVASYFAHSRLDEIRGTARVRCRIPRLRLGAGKYLVSVSVSDPYHGLLDSLDAAGWFTVESHDPYGTGELYHPVYGPVIEDSFWQMQ